MGASLSWIAVSGKSKADILACLSLVETDTLGESHDFAISGTPLPGGWYLLALDDYAHPFVTDAALEELSSDCTVVGCQVEEHVMASAAFCFSNGKRSWSVEHESERGIHDLRESGDLPPSYQSIRTRLLAEQHSEGDQQVDFVFDVPVSLAHDLCSYRHDASHLESAGVGTFTKLHSNLQFAGPSGVVVEKRPIPRIDATIDDERDNEQSSPRWLQVVLGVALGALLVPCFAGAIMMTFLLNGEVPVSVNMAGLALLLASLYLLSICARMFVGERAKVRFTRPRTLRALAWLFLFLSAGSLIESYFVTAKLQGLTQGVGYISVFLVLRSLARRVAQRAGPV